MCPCAEEPKSNKECPRANGYFRHADPTACDKFVNCVEGVAHVLPCPPGLIYDDVRATCAWPHETKRECGVAKRGEWVAAQHAARAPVPGRCASCAARSAARGAALRAGLTVCSRSLQTPWRTASPAPRAR